MDRTERALASFLEEGEEMVETWTVETVNRGFELSVPGVGREQTIALTNRRLLWLDAELETVELDSVRGVTAESVMQHSSPALLMGGVLALILGVVATPAVWLLTSVSFQVALTPLVAGIGLLVLAIVVEKIRGGNDADAVHHYLDVRTEGPTVQIYGGESVLEEIAERIEGERS